MSSGSPIRPSGVGEVGPLMASDSSVHGHTRRVHPRSRAARNRERLPTVDYRLSTTDCLLPTHIRGQFCTRTGYDGVERSRSIRNRLSSGNTAHASAAISPGYAIVYFMEFPARLISGFPLTSGFFSKDGVLFKAFGNQVLHPYVATARSILESPECTANAAALKCQSAAGVVNNYFQAPAWLGKALFVIGILAATCTAFYMFRLLFKTFWGQFRGWAVDPAMPIAPDPFKNIEHLPEGQALLTTAGPVPAGARPGRTLTVVAGRISEPARAGTSSS